MYVKEVLEFTCCESATSLTPGEHVKNCPMFCYWATGSGRICPLYFLCDFILSATKIGPIMLVAPIAQNIPDLRSCKKALCMNVGIICQPVCVILSASLNNFTYEKFSIASTSLPYIWSHKTSYKTVLSQHFFLGHLFWP